MITVRDVTHRPDGRAALTGVSLEVEPGETLAVMGANGAGKTTLLRLLAGLDDPDAGEIRRDGLVGFAPEDPAAGLFAATVEAEVAYFPRNRGLDADRRAREAMRAMGVDHLRARNPFTLSRGEQRRVSIAAVLAGEPDVIALDEPTAGLDRHAAATVEDALDPLDVAVVVSTHDEDFALALADRVAVLDAGALAGLGPAAELLADAERLASAGIRPPAAVEWARRHDLDRVPSGPREAAALLEGAR